MRIAVFSDTHGRTDGMLRAVALEKPDLVIHLGDCERDLHPLRREYPDLAVRNVCGNCDFNAVEPDTAFFEIENVKIMATHGHRYGVKMSLDPMLNAAYFSGAKLVLFGHTHISYNKDMLGVRVLNPGSAGMGQFCSYGLVQIEKGMVLSCVLKPIPQS